MDAESFRQCLPDADPQGGCTPVFRGHCRIARTGRRAGAWRAGADRIPADPGSDRAVASGPAQRLQPVCDGRLLACGGKNFLRDKREQEKKQERLRSENEQHERNIAEAKADLAKFNKAMRVDADGNVVNDLHLNGFSAPKGCAVGSDEWSKAIGEKLLKIADTTRSGGNQIAIGSIYGFRVLVKTVEISMGMLGTDYENLFHVEGSRLLYSYNKGKLNHTSPRVSSGYPLQALQNIPSLIEQWETKLEDNRLSIEELSTILQQTWPKEDELRKLRADLGILDRKINEELHKGERSEEKSKKKTLANAA